MSESHGTSRREFLKSSSMAVAGAALAGGLSVARSAHAAGSGEMKVALIGCGGRGQGAIRDCIHAGAISGMKIRVIAAADAFEDNVRRAVTALLEEDDCKAAVDIPEERIFWGLDAYQKAIATGVDMVVMATPPGLRPIHYRAAIDAGCHVFMEKPCCVDAPGYRSLLETNKLADEKGRAVAVGLQRHHQPCYLETIQRIHDGAIGDIQFFRTYWNDAGVWTRKRQELEQLAGRKLTEMEYQVRNWYYFVWLCGDHIVEQHVHNLDVANWVKKAHPVSAVGMGGRQVTKGPDNGTIFDHHAVEFTYADGTKLFSQCRHIPNCWHEVREFAHGTKGWADCGHGAIFGQTPWRFRSGAPDTPYLQEHVDLQNAILKGEKINEGHYAADSTFTAVMGRMATYSGQLIEWDKAVAGGPSEMPSAFTWEATPPVVPDAEGSYEGSVPVPGIYKPY